MKPFPIQKVRKDFPILRVKVKGKPLVYLDNAATSQKPRVVIDAIKKYYETYNANVHRGIHTLSEKATNAFDAARETVGGFFNAEKEEIVFTKNTTESLNLLAYGLQKMVTKKSEILITEMEHHSNMVPWQQLAKRTGAKLVIAKMDSKGKLPLKEFKKKITKKTAIVAVTHMSNVLGTVNDVKSIAELAHKQNAIVVVDGAQSAPHMPVDVKKLDCDFFACSSHKICGPTGIGVLYGKKEVLENLPPFMVGGGMIREVRYDNATWGDSPWKFEAGTQNIAGVIAFAKAIDYLQKIGMDNIQSYVHDLGKYAYKKLSQVKGLTLYGPPMGKDRGAVFAFNLEGIHPHDVSSILDDYGVAVRGGHHCAMPLMGVLKIQASCRASFYFYNTKKEVDKLIQALEACKKLFA